MNPVQNTLKTNWRSFLRRHIWGQHNMELKTWIPGIGEYEQHDPYLNTTSYIGCFGIVQVNSFLSYLFYNNQRCVQ